MRVLGIDPGYGRCGVAVVERNGNKESLLHSHCIETSRTENFSDRLFEIGSQIEKLIAEFAPDAIAIEEVYFSNNQKTALNVAEVRGMLLYIARRSNTIVGEYNPTRVKIAMTGHGRATKEQVKMMIERIYRPTKQIALDDEYDAIAVAVTHLAEAKNPHSLRK